MRKLLILAVVCFAAVTTANAQIYFGAKAAVSLLSTDVNSIASATSHIKSKDAGFGFGLYSRIQVPLLGLFVQPELMYNHAKYTIVSDAGVSSKVAYNNLELPVLVGGKFLFFRVNAGPVFNLKTFKNDDRVDVYRPDIGFQVGLGLTFVQRIDIDARYQGYFSGKSNKFVINENTNNLKVAEGMWLLSVGVLF